MEADKPFADEAFRLLLIVRLGGRGRCISAGAIAMTDDEEILGELRRIGVHGAFGVGRMPWQQGCMQDASQQGQD